MEALEAIFTRRSVRRFNSNPIKKEVIDVILHAAMSAPSARNGQPWQFLVVNDRKLLNQLPEIHPYAKMCLEATAAIIPCFDSSLYKHDDLYWVEDLSAATMNILLAIRALELGSVWLGVYPDMKRAEEVKKLFDLPSAITPFSLIPFGYTDMKQEPVDRYKKERVHYNKWEGNEND